MYVPLKNRPTDPFARAQLGGLTTEAGGILMRVGGAIGGFVLAPMIRVPGFIGGIVGYLLGAGIAKIGGGS